MVPPSATSTAPARHGQRAAFSGTSLQLEADPDYHGRVFSLEIGTMTLVLAVSGYCSGQLVEWGIPISHVVFGLSLLALPPALIWGGTLLVTWRLHDSTSVVYPPASNNPDPAENDFGRTHRT